MIITLLPKTKDACKLQQFRPICLLNCLYKLVTKTLTLRIEKVADKLFHRTQFTFMKNRNIINEILALHETRISNSPELIFKLGFEKTYDKGIWAFLFEVP